MPLTTALFITFLVLKLTHVIAWSWLWVTSPLWASAALGVVVLVLGGGAVLFTGRPRKRR